MVLTKRQKEVFDFIKNYVEKEGVSPSFNEIAAHFNFSSKGTVYRHIHTLEKKGFIYTNKNKSRSIRLKTEKETLFELPVVGTISRRSGIQRFKIPDYISIPGHLACKSGDSLYLVNDSGFRDEYILKGDLLIVTTLGKDIGPAHCLVQVDGRDFIVKKYHFENDIIKLFSVNCDLLPLFYEPSRVRVIGKISGIIREF
ncbi:MAG: repressor LexA [Candidatus Marinimicrobia bacterium]|nr:repressor LexA [Candidatus Neomarinimicrobiota bacterium]